MVIRPNYKQEKYIKKVVVTITSVVFALGLAGAGLAQTFTTTEKPKVKTKAPAGPATMAPKETAKPGEKPAGKETAKPSLNHRLT